MRRKAISKITALTVVFALIFTVAASAATFSDISDHWSKSWVEKVAELGLVEGYPDGTFGPEKNVTVLESLIMLSRLYDIDDDVKEDLVDYYQDTLENMPNNSDYEWAYEGLSIILELNVLSESGLKSLFSNKSLSQKAAKEEVAVLMTKALMLGDEAKDLSVYTLPFNDAAKISTDARPYISMMYSKGILTGDNEKNINPKANIKRAEMATMLVRAHEYIEDNNVEPELINYKSTTEVTGIIDDITENRTVSAIDIKQDNDEIKVIKVTDKTKILKNGKASTLDKLEKGMIITAQVDDDLEARSVDIDSETKIITGTVNYVATSKPQKISIYDEKDKKIEYNVTADKVDIYLDGQVAQLKELDKKDLVSLRIKNNVLYRIDARSRIQEYTGKITAIDLTSLPLKITIQTDKNEKKNQAEKTMTFEYSSDIEITRNKNDSSFDQLRVGDVVEIVTIYDELSELDATSTEAEMKGIITGIIIEDRITLRIKDNDGNTDDYVVASNAKVSINGKNASVYDLKKDYQVEINLSGEEIVTIDSTAPLAETFNGKVIFINSDEKTIMMQNMRSNGQTEIVYVVVENSTKITDTQGKVKYFKDIDEGSNISATVSKQDGENIALFIMIQ